MVITRFAPSPTGLLHVGNARTALINWLFAKANGGKFILRIDDTDKERSRPEFEDAIKRDLEWLGLEWDEIYHQSKRLELYEDAKNQMIKNGRLYPCYETQEELEIKKKIALNRNLPPQYDRAALKLPAEEKAKFEARGVLPHYRFLLSEQPIGWEDGVRGTIHFDPKNIGDPVLVRGDGTMTYMIASVVDDIDFKITNIIRGEDHITNSAIHIQMFEALQAQPPNFAHLSLIKHSEGKISKRVGGFDIASLREMGIQPIALNSFLTKMGSSDPIEYRKSLSELIQEFSLKKFSKAPATYDLLDLERLNKKLIHNLTFSEAKASLPPQVDEQFWDTVKVNLNTIEEIQQWWTICNEKITPIIQDIEFTKEAAKYLPEGQWDDTTWDDWIKALKQATGRTGADLFMPLRKALTGMEHGPELKKLLPILGREKTVSRLKGGES